MNTYDPTDDCIFDFFNSFIVVGIIALFSGSAESKRNRRSFLCILDDIIIVSSTSATSLVKTFVLFSELSVGKKILCACMISISTFLMILCYLSHLLGGNQLRLIFFTSLFAISFVGCIVDANELNFLYEYTPSQSCIDKYSYSRCKMAFIVGIITTIIYFGICIFLYFKSSRAVAMFGFTAILLGSSHIYAYFASDNIYQTKLSIAITSLSLSRLVDIYRTEKTDSYFAHLMSGKYRDDFKFSRFQRSLHNLTYRIFDYSLRNTIEKIEREIP